MTFSYRHKEIDHFFGTSFYTLEINDNRIQVKNKKAILKRLFRPPLIVPVRQSEKRGTAPAPNRTLLPQAVVCVV